MPRIRMRKRKNKNKNKNKINNKQLVTILAIAFSCLFFSIIFSILNIGNKKIIKNVKIGTIDVSGLSREEAKEKIEKWKNEIATKKITARYENYEETINVKEFENEINVDNLVKQACEVGRKGNIVKNNYEILHTLIFSKKIDTNIEIDENKINKEIKEINSKIPNAMEQSDYYIEEDKLIIKKGKIGNQVAKEEFNKKISDTINSENKTIEIPVKKEEPQEINIDEIYKETYKEAQNASIEGNPVKVTPEVIGVDFAITIEDAKKLLQEEQEECIIPLKITYPEITLASLGKEAFPQLLGQYSTTYSTENENRVTNLQLASEKINGTIILPGETFSYNKIVGERTIEKGYKEAAVYAGGKVVDGIGGGICQLSSTLYNAVLYANLEVTERSNHRFLTSYVSAGRDATVSWGTIDFCFKNTRKYPIKIVTIVKNGVVTTSIYGIKEEKEYEILIESNVVETIPYSTTYVKDKSLKEGQEVIRQYGANGAKSETYKIVKDNETIISRTLLSSDTYSPLERIIKKSVSTAETSSQAENEKTSVLNEINPELLEQIKELD